MIAPLICGGIFILSMVILAISALRSSQGEPRPDAPDSWEMMREMGMQGNGVVGNGWDDVIDDPAYGTLFDDDAYHFGISDDDD